MLASQLLVAFIPTRGFAIARTFYEGIPGLRFVSQDQFGIWSAPGGAKVAWFADPDGNTLTLSSHPTD